MRRTREPAVVSLASRFIEMTLTSWAGRVVWGWGVGSPPSVGVSVGVSVADPLVSGAVSEGDADVSAGSEELFTVVSAGSPAGVQAAKVPASRSSASRAQRDFSMEDMVFLLCFFPHYTGKSVLRQVFYSNSRGGFFLETFFEKGIAFFHGLWYNIMRLRKALFLNASYSERYRSGHNGADSKSVCAKAHEGSNPSLSAIKERTFVYQMKVRFFVFLGVFEPKSR